MARKGTDAAKVAELKELYDKILADDEMVEWLNDTMLLEVDTMTEDDVKAHIENVKSIVEQYKDIVAADNRPHSEKAEAGEGDDTVPCFYI